MSASRRKLALVWALAMVCNVGVLIFDPPTVDRVIVALLGTLPCLVIGVMLLLGAGKS
jgi:hypothetical protein